MNMLKTRPRRVQRPAHTDAGGACLHELLDGAEGLDVHAQRDGRKLRFESPNGIHEPARWQHHVDDQRYLGLQTRA